MHRQFEELRERLLRVGVAPRRVRRYVGELGDHFEDLVAELKATGVTAAEAENAALERIGGNDELARQMLAHPGVRSFTARMPILVFGLGPIAALAFLVVAATLIEGGVVTLQYAWASRWTDGQPFRPEWFEGAVAAWNWLVIYGAPVLIASLIYFVGIRQRMAPRWILLGVVITAFIGAFHEIGIRWSDIPGQSELSVGFGLYPPFLYSFEHQITRLVVNVALVAGVYWFWLRRPEKEIATT